MADSVVMEATKQDIIKAITHPQNRAWKLDFIRGKGEGQIVLLHGLLPRLSLDQHIRYQNKVNL